ncbi:hypothetical protein MMC16_000741 [Acarospora aff. strigata]|nr:hypothetical protein [Acarospora aff. strigata]
MEKNNLTREELDGIYTFAIDLTRRAGKLLLEGAERRYGDAENRGVVEAHLEKENAVDLVTKMDEDVEDFVRREINRVYPSHKSVLSLIEPYLLRVMACMDYGMLQLSLTYSIFGRAVEL